jgi:predicted NodU family carbamoyl transferase
MPFAPSVLAERSADYFVKPKLMPALHMIMTFDTTRKAICDCRRDSPLKILPGGLPGS